MLVIYLVLRITTGMILTLAGRLLKEIVGNEKACFPISKGQANPVPLGQISLQGTRERRVRAVVGETVDYRRIQAVIRQDAFARDRAGGVAGHILSGQKASNRIETACLNNRSSVEIGRGIALRVHFDHSA